MMNASKTLGAMLVAGWLLLGLSGCDRDEPARTEGPAEKLGQQVDQAASKAAVEINKFAEKAGNALERAGESLENRAREAQQEGQRKEGAQQ